MAEIIVQPLSGLIDTQLEVRISGLEPGVPVWVRAETSDELGQVWQSYAEVVADQQGKIDLGKVTPRAGTFTVADPNGLLWSMYQVNDDPYPSYRYMPFMSETTTNAAPLRVKIWVESKNRNLCETGIERVFMKEGVGYTDISRPGFAGKTFMPAGEGPFPAALLFGGSNGGFGWASQMAALLASYGRAALAVAYFDWAGRFPGLPGELNEIPLEYFLNAVDQFAQDPRVTLDDLAVMGISKGGELALVLASVSGLFKKVVAYVPSSVVLQSIRRGDQTPTSSWSYQGKPLPFLPYPEDTVFGASFDKSTLRELHDAAMKNQDAALKARIPVEKIRADILLISATDDREGDTAGMSEQVVQKLRQVKFPGQVKHLCLQGCGHMIDVPNFPANFPVTTIGGDMTTNANGSRAAWDEVKRFLNLGE